MNLFNLVDLWPFLVLAWPLLIALVPVAPQGTRAALWLLPLAPLPALGFAIAGAPGNVLLPDLLLGVSLGAVPGGALLLGMTAAVWIVAGLHAALTFPRDWASGIFSGFWCLTLAGNLGVFLAADLVTFYVAFAAVSLAAWFLVVHERTAAALHAGKVYIVLAIIGEAALLAGLLIGAEAAGSGAISEVRAALAESPLGPLAMLLLITGFGIKAGMVPLHVWLPLAHPAAPVPGSAVLSGAIVKAGLIGMLLFLPFEAFPSMADMVLAAGLAGTFGAAIWGLTQRNPKAVLAYSTISQLGLMLALTVTAAHVVPLYALHHGLAKAALFLLVGVFLAATTKGQRLLVLAAAGVVALSVAGLPFSGGALVKAAAKAEVATWLAWAITLSGVTTTALLGWFALMLAQKPLHADPGGQQASEKRWRYLVAGPLLLGLGAMVLPLVIGPAQGAPSLAYMTQAKALLEALLPMVIGLGLLAVLARRALPQGPMGDLIAWLPSTSRPRFAPLGLLGDKAWHAWRLLWVLGRRRAYRVVLRAEAKLLRWPLAGVLLTATVLVLAVMLRPA